MKNTIATACLAVFSCCLIVGCADPQPTNSVEGIGQDKAAAYEAMVEADNQAQEVEGAAESE